MEKQQSVNLRLDKDLKKIQEGYMNGSRSQGLIKFQSAWFEVVQFILTSESGIDP